MLGSLKRRKDWVWAASGKHPAAPDYIRLGEDLPIFNAFYSWVEHGFAQMGREHAQNFSSWRFWARGTMKSHLVCGLVRDSHDSIGRPFPCLVMGTGPLEGWEDHWDQLPLLLEATWKAMEWLFVKHIGSADELSAELKGLQPVGSTFSHKDIPGHDNFHMDDISQEGIRRSDLGGDDPCTDAAVWLSSLKPAHSPVPNAMFIGGTPEKSGIFLFQRSLMPADFSRLFSADS